MNIGILAVDSNFPNLALMKISAYHKARGDQVEWYNPLCKYDKVYAAKVFTFTPDYNYYINANQIEKGGTGYDFVFRSGLDDVTGYWMPVFSGDVKLGNVLIGEVGSLKVVRGYAPCV